MENSQDPNTLAKEFPPHVIVVTHGEWVAPSGDGWEEQRANTQKTTMLYSESPIGCENAYRKWYAHHKPENHIVYHVDVAQTNVYFATQLALDSNWKPC